MTIKCSFEKYIRGIILIGHQGELRFEALMGICQTTFCNGLNSGEVSFCMTGSPGPFYKELDLSMRTTEATQKWALLKCPISDSDHWG